MFRPKTVICFCRLILFLLVLSLIPSVGAVALSAEGDVLDLALTADNWNFDNANVNSNDGMLAMDRDGGSFWIFTKRAIPENFRLDMRCRVEFLKGSQQVYSTQFRIFRSLCVRFGVDDTTSSVTEPKGHHLRVASAQTILMKEGQFAKVLGKEGPIGQYNLTVTKKGGEISVAVNGQVILSHTDDAPMKGAHPLSIGGFLSRVELYSVKVTDLGGGAPAPAAIKPRMWLSADGKSRIEAKFVEFDDPTVKLKRTSGDIISVPISQLSATDQKHVLELAGIDPSSYILPSQRRSVPQASEIEAKKKDILSIYGEEYKSAGDSVTRKALAEKLFDLAVQSSGNSAADEFVLLEEAMGWAAKSGDMDYFDQVSRRMAQMFLIEPADLIDRQAEALFRASRTTPMEPESTRKLALACEGMIDDAVKAGAYEAGERIAGIGSTIALKIRDTALSRQIASKKKEITKAKTARRVAMLAFEKLRTNPTDGDANLKVGTYFCFNLDQWSKGIPYLAKSGDAKLSLAARYDHFAPTDPKKQLMVADAWWAVISEGEFDGGRPLLYRASNWYRRALPGLTALDKAKAEQRLVDIDKRISEAAIAAGDAPPGPTLLSAVKKLGFRNLVMMPGQKSIYGPVTVSGTLYSNSIWAMPIPRVQAQIGFDLGGKYKTLSGHVGISDAMQKGAPLTAVTCMIVGDGKELWHSNPLTGSGYRQPFNISVEGISKLALVSSNGGANRTAMPAVWCDPTLNAEDQE